MSASLDAALDGGALVLTATARLAHDLALAYDQRQRALGYIAWPTPAVFSWDAWLAQQAAESCPLLLLDAAQEQWLWEDIITREANQAGHAAPLLDAAATARLAASAWKLAHAWQLPLTGREWQQSEETEAFERWASAFADRCASLCATTLAQLAPPPPASPVYLAGFDELTPQQTDLLAAWQQAGCEITHASSADDAAPITIYPTPDAAAELSAAAVWTRTLLDDGAPGPIGVILPDLTSARADIARTFAEVLHPGREPWSSAPAAFHLSLGSSLAESPLVAAALFLLALTGESPSSPSPIADLSALLRLSFLAGGDSESSARASLDAHLRSKYIALLSLVELRRRATAVAPQLARALAQAAHFARTQPRRQRFAEWSLGFAALLDACGWPGERPLPSAEHQTLDAWRDLLASLARLEQIAPAPVDRLTALARLRHLAAARTFQPRAQSTAPVQIMGWGEAAGQQFTHLWLAGLHDAAMPPPASPHPFLPLDWQRQRGLPHATPERERAAAQQRFDRLRRSAPALIASYPLADRDTPLRPSPLLAGAAPATELDFAIAAIPAAPLESFPDLIAPPLAPNRRAANSNTFFEQSACPFRAFVRLRLQGTSLPPPPAGLSPLTRGILIHAVLRNLWTELASQQALLAMPADDRRALVARHAAAVVAAEPLLEHRPRLAQAECQRLITEVCAWLEEDAKRTPAFTVATKDLEAPREVAFAGLDLRLRLDRTDHLADGTRMLVDYKSGIADPKGWLGPRPSAPQLPLYLVTDPDPGSVSAIAFAQLKPGHMKLRISPDLTSADWPATLASLADEYLRGHAIVQPAPDACEYCDLPPLCRIAVNPDAADDGEETALAPE